MLSRGKIDVRANNGCPHRPANDARRSHTGEPAHKRHAVAVWVPVPDIGGEVRRWR